MANFKKKKSRRRYKTGSIQGMPNGRARVLWREGGRRRSANFPDVQAAEIFLAGRIGDLLRERIGLPPDPRRIPTLSVLVPPWIERRSVTHRSWRDDAGRWRNHLAPFFGRYRPGEITLPLLREYVETQRRAGMCGGNLGAIMTVLSRIMTSLAERPRETGIDRNPCKGLPRDLTALLRSDHDPRFTPYVEDLRDAIRIYQALEGGVAVAYAIGVHAGPRTGEILGLCWSDVHEADWRIDIRRQVRDGREGPPKDGARIVQGECLRPLVPILREWRLRTGGKGPVVPPVGRGRWLDRDSLSARFRAAVTACELPAILGWDKAWYQATRHTMATHWMRAGHSLGELAFALGHSATSITENYAHIRPSREAGLDLWTLDLRGPIRAAGGES